MPDTLNYIWGCDETNCWEKQAANVRGLGRREEEKKMRKTTEWRRKMLLNKQRGNIFSFVLVSTATRDLKARNDEEKTSRKSKVTIIHSVFNYTPSIRTELIMKQQSSRGGCVQHHSRWQKQEHLVMARHRCSPELYLCPFFIANLWVNDDGCGRS